MTTLAPHAPALGLPAATLAGIVHSIAGREEAWRPLAQRTDQERVARLLMRDDQVEVWVISWGAGHDTGFHDHGGSAAAFTVVEGSLVEERLYRAGEVAAQSLERDDPARIVPAEVVHRVHHPTAGSAVSIHAYSPPLTELGAYRVAESGRLERTSQPGDDMLEPQTTERSHASVSGTASPA